LIGGLSLELLEVATWRSLSRFEGHTQGVRACALSPDDRRALSGSFDTTLRLWDLKSGRELRRFTGHSDEVRACAFTPDGRRAVSASYDGTLRVWQLDGGEFVRLVGHGDSVIACAVTPDGTRVVSCSKDCTVRIWDLETGRLLSILEGHTDWVNACAITPDGARLVTASDDRTLRVWDLENRRALNLVCGIHWFRSVAAGRQGLVAGDELGNLWFLTDQPFQPARRDQPTPRPHLSPESSTLRFLHLTDWHVGMVEQGWLWPNVREVFFDDLARLHERLGGIDAVFFTGDLTQRGSAAEFDELDQGLAAIWRRLAELGSVPALLAVPGNHDLVRPPPKNAVVKALGAWQADQEIRDAFWSEAESDYHQCVRTAFAHYAAWAERKPAMKRAEPHSGALPGDVAAVLERGGLRVGVVGLNSAFLQLTGADYEKKLDLDVRQLHAVCDGDAPAWLAQNDLNLLLTHHPPAWLEPKRLKGHFETEVAPPSRFALHLHGHMHEPGAHAEAAYGSRSRHRLQGPSLFGLERFEGPGGVSEQRIHGYTAGRIELAGGEGAPECEARARVRLWPRRLVTKGSGARVMERDGDFELEADESFAFDVPCNRRFKPATVSDASGEAHRAHVASSAGRAQASRPTSKP
jgi:predicted MPP superfamily phosphohydrolase